MRTLIVIPARLESSRLPRKLLLAETGMPLLRHVVEQCEQSRADHIILAFDCEELLSALAWHMVGTVKTGRGHPNGTSRAGEIAQAYPADTYCIVQADEPEIPPELIDAVVQALEDHPEWDCATAAYRAGPDSIQKIIDDESRVKVLLLSDGIARDFSRRAAAIDVHIGIYAYRREALLKYAAAGPCEREQKESLEQLRALHIGLTMGVVLWDGPHHGGIDTREQYDAFVTRWQQSQAATEQ